VSYLLPEVELMYLLCMRRPSQKSPKVVSRARSDRVFIGKRVRWIQVWHHILNRQ